MGTWVPISGDWTGTINGVPVGAGTVYRLATLTGWRQIIAGPTGSSGQLLPPRQSMHGSFKQPYYIPFRIVNVGLAVMGTSVAQFEQALQTIEAATVPNRDIDVPVSFQINGLSTTINALIETRDILTDLESQFGMAHITVGLKAADPRRFSTALTGTTPLPSTAGGLTFNVTPNITFTPGSSTGAITLKNSGDATGPLTFRVNGPLSGAFTITNATTGQFMGFNSSVSIAAGDYLLVDMENRVALYNGLAQASRNYWITNRGWFGFAPGSNTFQFNASTFSASASLVATATPAWL